MDIDTYCMNLARELSEWEGKLSKEIRKIDQLPSAHKQKMLPIIEDFNIIATEMKKRIDHLKTYCPIEWYYVSDDMDNGITSSGVSPEKADEAIGEGNFGG